jgi:ribosome maturation factor RimP
MAQTDKIKALLDPIAGSKGLGIVGITYGRRVLSILVERLDGKPLSIDEISDASRTFSAHLDVADIIKERYFLEVGSAGLDRPLSSPADFKRFEGKEAKVELLDIEPGKLKGKISSATDKTVTIGETAINYTDIKKAKLHLTDEDYRKLLKGVK